MPKLVRSAPKKKGKKVLTKREKAEKRRIAQVTARAAPSTLRLSADFKNSRIKLSEDRLTATGYRGYASVLALEGVCEGKWYFEVEILEPGAYPFATKFVKIFGKPVPLSEQLDLDKLYSVLDEPSREAYQPHCRIGWSTRMTGYDMPLGSDPYSYSVRDFKGEVVAKGRRKHYFDRSFCVGDIVGCLVSLSPPTVSLPTDIHPGHAESLFWTEGLLCNLECPPPPVAGEGNVVEWTLNGKGYGPAFTDTVQGKYYPAVSLFMGARVSFRFYKEQMQHFSIELEEKGYRPIGESYCCPSEALPKPMPDSYIPRGQSKGEMCSFVGLRNTHLKA